MSDPAAPPGNIGGEDGRHFVLPAQVTIRDIRSVHADLMTVAGDAGLGLIDCSAVEDADICLLQLLLAARRTGGTGPGARPPALVIPPGSPVARLIEQAGLAGELA